MASATQASRPPIALTVVMLLVVLVVGFIATQWVVGIVLGIIRLLMILVAFYVIARIGLYLLRKGPSAQ